MLLALLALTADPRHEGITEVRANGRRTVRVSLRFPDMDRSELVHVLGLNLHTMENPADSTMTVIIEAETRL
jgi:hypothetical protein